VRRVTRGAQRCLARLVDMGFPRDAAAAALAATHNQVAAAHREREAPPSGLRLAGAGDGEAEEVEVVEAWRPKAAAGRVALGQHTGRAVPAVTSGRGGR
jgi:hypothetical protein